MKTFISSVFIFTAILIVEDSFAQGVRPDALDSLYVWVRADSLKPAGILSYSDGQAVDSAYNWGAIGGYFTQTNSSSKPTYRTGASPSGLPMLDFDANDAIRSTLSNSNWKFLHDGTIGYSVIFVLKFDALNHTHIVAHTNSGSSSFTGFSVLFNNIEKFSHIITSVGYYVINNVTSKQFDQTSGIQIFYVRFTRVGSDTSRIKANGEFQTYAVKSGSYGIGDATYPFDIGYSSTSIDGRLCEFIIYGGEKTDAELADVGTYLMNKWTNKTEFPPIVPDLFMTSLMPHVHSVAWNKVAGMTYYLSRLQPSVHYSHPYRSVIKISSSDNDTTYSDAVNIPYYSGMNIGYTVRTWDGTLMSNETDTLLLRSPEIGGDSVSLHELHNHAGNHDFPQIPSGFVKVAVLPHDHSMKWSRISGIVNYSLSMANAPVFPDYPYWNVMKTSADEHDTSFAIYGIPFPGFVKSYKVRAWNGTLMSNHGDTLQFISMQSDPFADSTGAHAYRRWTNELLYPGSSGRRMRFISVQ